MMNTTLLTAQDAIDYGPGDQHVSGSLLSVSIASSEEALFNDRFGWKFYEKMLDDRYTYQLKAAGGVDDDQTGNRYYQYYDPATTGIAVGSFMLARNIVYKCLRLVESAGIDPSNTDYYQVADRFKTECYEQLWRRYMRLIIALSVHRDGLLSRSYKETARGAVKQYEEGKSKPLTVAELGALKSEVEVDIERNIRNMERYIRRSGTQCFTLYGQLETTGSGCDADDDSLAITKPGATRIKNYGFTLPNSDLW